MDTTDYAQMRLVKEYECRAFYHAYCAQKAHQGGLVLVTYMAAVTSAHFAFLAHPELRG